MQSSGEQIPFAWAGEPLPAEDKPKRAVTSAMLYKRWKWFEARAQELFDLYRQAVGAEKALLATYSDSATEPARKRKSRAPKRTTKARGKVGKGKRR